MCISAPPTAHPTPLKIKNIKRLERDLKFKKTKCRPGNGSVRTKTPVSAISPMSPKPHFGTSFFFQLPPPPPPASLSESAFERGRHHPCPHLSVLFLGLLLPVGGAAVASAGTVVGYVHIHGRSMASTKPQDYFRRSNTHTCRRDAHTCRGRRLAKMSTKD